MRRSCPMALATVWVIPSTVEPIFWLVIFLVCAFLIARSGAPNPFLHGFLVSIVNAAWITSVHVIFAGAYLARHPQEAEMLKTMPMPDAPRLMMAITGPVVGIVSGLVLGALALIASKIVKPKA